MEQLRQWRFLLRLFLYVAGLFFIALGSCISINSNLGISPVSSLPYVISLIADLPLSGCIIAIYSLYVALQIVILGRNFRLTSFAQLVFAVIFGYLMDLAAVIIGDFSIPTYPGKLIMLGMSMILIALGVLIYVNVHLIPMPMEGLTLALSYRTKLPFHNMKIAVDCAVVGLSILISLLCTRKLVGVREGTIITAVLVGKVMAIIGRPIVPMVRRIAIGKGVEI